jgi:hypothetical protein
LQHERRRHRWRLRRRGRRRANRRPGRRRSRIRGRGGRWRSSGGRWPRERRAIRRRQHRSRRPGRWRRVGRLPGMRQPAGVRVAAPPGRGLPVERRVLRRQSRDALRSLRRRELQLVRLVPAEPDGLGRRRRDGRQRGRRGGRVERTRRSSGRSVWWRLFAGRIARAVLQRGVLQPGRLLRHLRPRDLHVVHEVRPPAMA